MVGHVKKPKEDKNKKPVVIFDSEAGLDRPAMKPDGVALTIVRKSDTSYVILKVEVDSVNMLAGTPEVIDTATNRFEANEKFKIHVVKNGII